MTKAYMIQTHLDRWDCQLVGSLAILNGLYVIKWEWDSNNPSAKVELDALVVIDLLNGKAGFLAEIETPIEDILFVGNLVILYIFVTSIKRWTFLPISFANLSYFQGCSLEWNDAFLDYLHLSCACLGVMEGRVDCDVCWLLVFGLNKKEKKK